MIIFHFIEKRFWFNYIFCFDNCMVLSKILFLSYIDAQLKNTTHFNFICNNKHPIIDYSIEQR